MYRTKDDFHVYIILILGFIQDVLSGSIPNGTTFEYDEINTTDSYEETGTDVDFCCHNPIYTIAVLAGVICFPAIICARMCWLKRKARRITRGRIDMNERHNETIDGTSLYTIETDDRLCNIYGPPPSYDTCLTNSTELPPAYDSPPPYSDVQSNSQT